MENGKLKIILSGGGTEGNLCTGKSACAKCLCQRKCICCVVNFYNRYDTDFLNIF